jgi:hypothetical protein
MEWTCPTDKEKVRHDDVATFRPASGRIVRVADEERTGRAD